MGDDRKIADTGEIGHGALKRSGRKIRCRRVRRNGSSALGLRRFAGQGHAHMMAKPKSKLRSPRASPRRRRCGRIIEASRRTSQIFAMREISKHGRLPRRDVLLGATAATLLAAPSRLAWAALAPTPRQTPGPFYPRTLPLDSDNDLARIAGHARDAGGTITHLSGHILDPAGAP